MSASSAGAAIAVPAEMNVPRIKRSADPKLAVAYIRCSTDEQQHGPRAQRDAIERWCAAHGLQLASIHDDLGVSGAAPIDERPGLLAALDALRDRGAGVLIVAKRDRLARDVVISAMIDRLVAREGARVDSTDGTGNGEGAEAELMRGLVALFAQYERALIRARTRAALASKKRRGERVGQVPIGWEVHADGVRLVREDDEAEAVALAVRLREQGLTLRTIGYELERAGFVPRGRAWYAGTVARMIAQGARSAETTAPTRLCAG